MGDIAEEGREEENYEHLCKRLSEFHCTLLGEAGDGRLSSKRKNKGFDAAPALGDAENATPGEEPPAAAAAPTAAAAVDAAPAASETPLTPPTPAGKRKWRPALGLAALRVGE